MEDYLECKVTLKTSLELVVAEERKVAGGTGGAANNAAGSPGVAGQGGAGGLRAGNVNSGPGGGGRRMVRWRPEAVTTLEIRIIKVQEAEVQAILKM